MFNNLQFGTRRLFIALLGSALLHLTFIFWGWLHLSSREPGRQITLQVSLQPLQKTVQNQPKITPPREKSHNKTREKKRKQALPESKKILSDIRPSIPESEKAPEPAQESKPEKEQEKEQESKPEPVKAPEQNDNTEAVPLDRASVPAYPAEAVKKGLESCVLAAVQVSSSGEVLKVVIIHTDVANIFDQSVIDAHSTVRYLPARKNGDNLPSRVLAIVGFTLEPGRRLNCALKYAGAARAINALPVATEIDVKMVGGLIGKQ